MEPYKGSQPLGVRIKQPPGEGPKLAPGVVRPGASTILVLPTQGPTRESTEIMEVQQNVAQWAHLQIAGSATAVLLLRNPVTGQDRGR